LDERGVVVAFTEAQRGDCFVVADAARGDILFANAIAADVVETILVGV
jgi:ribonucleotide monophosphatase NagD (HAD superfamily)